MKFEIKEMLIVPGINHAIDAEEVVGSHIYPRANGELGLVYIVRKS